jgi:hypothetical protein
MRLWYRLRYLSRCFSARVCTEVVAGSRAPWSSWSVRRLAEADRGEASPRRSRRCTRSSGSNRAGWPWSVSAVIIPCASILFMVIDRRAFSEAHEAKRYLSCWRSGLLTCEASWTSTVLKSSSRLSDGLLSISYDHILNISFGMIYMGSVSRRFTIVKAPLITN